MSRVVLVLFTFAVAVYAANIRWPAPQLDGRIVGGENANIEDFPYQLSLEKDGSHVCGASIVHPEWALTAAHCVVGTDAETVTLRAGSSRRGNGGTIHQAVDIILHPNYDNGYYDFDYALIMVEDKFDVTQPGVQVIEMATEEPQAGVQTVVTGWGSLSSSGFLPLQLQKVEVPVVDRKVCREQYRNYEFTSRMMCAGLIEGGKDACQGDSGGPLVANGELVGVVSWGLGCAEPNYAGVYANVANQRPWIRAVIDYVPEE